MSRTQTSSHTAVLDRPGRSPSAAVLMPTFAPRLDEDPADAVEAPSVDDRTPSFRAPALVALAAVAICEGYVRLGVIPSDRTGLSGGAASQPLAVVLALLLTAVGVALTHRKAELRRRYADAAMPGAGAVVVTAAIVVVAAGGQMTLRVLGVAFLLLAAAALGAAATNKRSRVSGPLPAADATDRTSLLGGRR